MPASEFNWLHHLIYPLLSSCDKLKKVPNNIKTQIIDIVKDFDGYINEHILHTWVCFSGKSVKTLDELFKKDFWNCIRQTDYPSVEGYLEGIDVVCESFYTLIPKYKNDPKALFVLNPPYLCTQRASYSGKYEDNLVWKFA
ncbi:MAG: hypothetical protein SOX56_06910 [[Pasteurella] mairii]|nr:hypothetical protein [[Pasteurella] mairii]